MPVLAELGPETVQHFELDTARLDEIVNGDAPAEQRVSTDDIALLAMVSTQESYAKLSLRSLMLSVEPAAGRRPPRRQPGERDAAAPLRHGTVSRHGRRRTGRRCRRPRTDACARPRRKETA